jgi:hypothetical protein
VPHGILLVFGCRHVLSRLFTKFCVTSIFFQIWWIIYLFFGHVVLVEEPLAVTNILGSGTEKILVTAGGSFTNTT